MAENERPKEELGRERVHVLNPIVNVNGYLTDTNQIVDEEIGKNQTDVNKTISDGNIYYIVDFYAIYSSDEYTKTDGYTGEWWQEMIDRKLTKVTWVEVSPDAEGTSSDNIPKPDKENPYLWRYREIHFQGEIYEESDPTRYIAPQIIIPSVISIYTGIKEIKYFYQISNHATNVPSDKDKEGNDLWKTESPAVTNEFPYLWRKSVTYYSDGSGPDVAYCMIGALGDPGIDGEKIEYIFIRTKEKVAPVNPVSELNSTDEETGEVTEGWRENTAYQSADWTPTTTIDGESWTDDPSDPDFDYQYVWISSRSRLYEPGGLDHNNRIIQTYYWDKFSQPSLWAKYSREGMGIQKVIYSYLISNITIESELIDLINSGDVTDNSTDLAPANANKNTWYKNSPAVTEENSYLWKRTVTYYGKDDDPETMVDESKCRIETKYEVVGSLGQPGIDGTNIEYIFMLTSTKEAPDNPTPYTTDEETGEIIDTWETDSNYQSSDWPGNLGESYTGPWTDEPQTPTFTMQYEWVCQRERVVNYRVDENGDWILNDNRQRIPYYTWMPFSEPALWAKYSQEGLGIEKTEVSFLIANVSTGLDVSKVENNSTAYASLTNAPASGTKAFWWYKTSPAATDSHKFLWKRTITYYHKEDDPETIYDESQGTLRTQYEFVGSLGQPGIDGTDIEYIFTLTSDYSAPSNPTPRTVDEEDNVVESWKTDANYQSSDWPANLGESYTGPWTDDPQEPDFNSPFEWICERKRIVKYREKSDGTPELNANGQKIPYYEWQPFSEPTLWAKYSKDGLGISLEEVSFLIANVSTGLDISKIDNQNTAFKDLTNAPAEAKAYHWYKTSPAVTVSNKFLWKRTISYYSKPDDPNTVYNEEDGTLKIRYEFIGSLGEPGVDGKDIEYIYMLTATKDAPSNPTPYTIDEETKEVIDTWKTDTNYQKADYTTGSWTDDPQNPTFDNQYEWVCVRERIRVNVIASNGSPLKTENDQYVYTYQWQPYSDPKLWAKYSQEGLGIEKVETSYLITDVSVNLDISKIANQTTSFSSLTNAPSSGAKAMYWYKSSPSTTVENKCLWKRTVTYYHKEDDPETVYDESKGTIRTVYEFVGSLGKPGIDGTDVEYIFTVNNDPDFGTEANNPTPRDIDEETEEIIDTWKTDANYQKADWPNNIEGYSGIWSDDPQNPTFENQYEWVCKRERKYIKTGVDTNGQETGYYEWQPFSNPTIWVKYSREGMGIEKVECSYLISNLSNGLNPDSISNKDTSYDQLSNAPANPTANLWYKTSPTVNSTYKHLWKRTVTYYSRGDDSNPIYNEDLGTLRIVYEHVGSLGDPGVDGAGVEWIYARNNNKTTYPTLTQDKDENGVAYESANSLCQKDDWIPSGWDDDALEPTSSLPYVWRAQRKYNKSTRLWEKFGTPKNLYTHAVSSFKSIVYCRCDYAPNTPTGGSYSTPWPGGTQSNNGTVTVGEVTTTISWTDGIPAGYQQNLWSSTRIFSRDGGDPQQSTWTTPQKISDNLGTEYMYSSVPTLTNDNLSALANFKRANNTSTTIDSDWLETANDSGWYDEPWQCPNDPIWQAKLEKVDGVWPQGGGGEVSEGKIEGGDWIIIQIKGEKGDKGDPGTSAGAVKSTVFCRTNDTPEVPLATQGSFNSPNPPTAGWEVTKTEGEVTKSFIWHDGVPNGSAKLWAATRTFYINNSQSDATWKGPSQMTDTASFDVCFSSSESKPAAPTTHGVQNDGIWTNDGNDSSIWMATSSCSNGIWTEWVISRIKGEKGDRGESGVSPEAQFTSIVFCRTEYTPAAPRGGYYYSPIPTSGKDATGEHDITWTDGIPSGEMPLWSSTATFNSQTNATSSTTFSGWKTPTLMNDEADIEYLYSAWYQPAEIPENFKRSDDKLSIDPEWLAAANEAGWYDDPGETEINNTETDIAGNPWWMAIIKKVKGVWKDPQIMRVRGEDGEVGAKITIKGSVATSNDLPTTGNNVNDAYSDVATGHLWVWDGDSWVDAGKFSGENGKSQFLHIKYASAVVWSDKSKGEVSSVTPTGSNGEEPGDYIGTLVDENPDDSSTYTKYTWKYWRGQDGFGYEYIYCRTESDTAPELPNGEDYIPEGENPDNDDYIPTGWTDNLISVTETYRFAWECYRVKKDGSWSEFKGTSEGIPALVAKFAADGISPDATVKSTVFCRNNSKPDKPSNTNGSFATPNPSTEGWTVGDSGKTFTWYDGIPSGQAKLWASTRTFSTDPNKSDANWSEPAQMTDTSEFDVCFSASQSKPNAPTGHGIQTGENTWYDSVPASQGEAIWMATSTCSNGVWSNWVISKIKGERGDDGQSIKIKDSYDTETEFIAEWYDSENEKWISPSEKGYTEDAAFVVGTDLWVWDGSDEWKNVGQFTGEKGDPGTSYYFYVRYATEIKTWSSAGESGGIALEVTQTEPDGLVPGKYIGTCATTESTAPSLTPNSDDIQKYRWAKWIGDDGYGYEYIYKITTTEDAPDVPTETSQEDDYVPTGWSDNPPSVSSTQRFAWVCYRKKTNGSWSNFIGQYQNTTKAALWASYGEKGESGKDAIQMVIGTPIVSCLVDGNTKKTVDKTEITCEVSILRGDIPVDITNYSLGLFDEVRVTNTDGGDTLTSTTTTPKPGTDPEPTTPTDEPTTELVDSTIGSVTKDNTNKVFKVTVSVNVGLSVNDLPKRIEARLMNGGTKVTSGSIILTFPERGLVGPAGESGAMLVPYGNWTVGETYSVTQTQGGEISTRPFVYYQPTDKYYTLVSDSTTATASKTPDVDTDNWKEFTKIQYLFTEALMAQWARLGKSVFFGDFMFSEDGVSKDGVDGKYSSFETGENSMFKEDGLDAQGNQKYTLSGSFIPNLMVDFVNGSMKLGKLSESFVYLDPKLYKGERQEETKSWPIYNINLSGCHNVSNRAILNRADGTTVITLPKIASDSQKHLVNGSHCTIVHEYSSTYSQAYMDDEYRNSVTAVCADTIFTDITEWNNTSGSGVTNKAFQSNNGWFLWKGYRSKFIFMTPGTMLKLRSCLIEGNNLVWFVENSEDFEILNTSMYIATQENLEGELISSQKETSIQATVNPTNPAYIILGSPALNSFGRWSGDNFISENTVWKWSISGDLDNDSNYGFPGNYLKEIS